VNDTLNFMFPGGMGGGSLALNQLLVVMDGIDNPPFFKKFFTNKANTLLDGVYIVPRRLGRMSLRLPGARPRKEQIYFIGATNVPVDRLDPALTRPGRMGRHVWFRTPTKQDRLDILDLYLGKVSHEQELDQAHKREEIARVTNGYAPAMLEQVTSMALTIAHHSNRDALTWDDLVEAMTTLEAGTAVGVEYIPEESRAVAIHEAGHAAAGHAYLKGAESTRLSIRMRGGALGHHQALEKEERFSRFRSEEFARLVWALGAMAAERVFYGENSNGVGGDLQSVTAQAAFMVGASGMGPEPFAITPRDDETEEEARDRILERFEKIGVQMINRTAGGGPFSENPIASVLADRGKRTIACQLVGQAYVAAHNLVTHNREAVEHIANVLDARRELFGDELLNLLDESKITIPEVDLSEESSWPTM
jgi:cell division protease FtsH